MILRERATRRPSKKKHSWRKEKPREKMADDSRCASESKRTHSLCQNAGLSFARVAAETKPAHSLTWGPHDCVDARMTWRVRRRQASDFCWFSPCSAAPASSPTVFLSHIPPALASNHQLGNSIFLSHYSSSSLQLQPAERSERNEHVFEQRHNQK